MAAPWKLSGKVSRKLLNFRKVNHSAENLWTSVRKIKWNWNYWLEIFKNFSVPQEVVLFFQEFQEIPFLVRNFWKFKPEFFMKWKAHQIFLRGAARVCQTINCHGQLQSQRNPKVMPINVYLHNSINPWQLLYCLQHAANQQSFPCRWSCQHLIGYALSEWTRF